MKRSEAISKLLKRLESIKGCDPNTGEELYPRDEYLVYCMLDEMEQLGMSPPFDFDLYYKTFRNGGDGQGWSKE